MISPVEYRLLRDDQDAGMGTAPLQPLTVKRREIAGIGA